MINQMLNVMNKIFQAPVAAPAQVSPKPVSENPYASPFINSKDSFEGKNQPIAGGYFAGYYNGKKNIVGKRLFIAV